MNKREKKRALILDAMEKLIIEDKAADCSVSEIAKTAGIGKGSIYYYYRSKREIEIDLYYKTFGGFVENCEHIPNIQGNALEKMKILFKTYYSQTLNLAIDNYLHLPQNMDMHQKVLSKLVETISPILSKIIECGVGEGIFDCDKPSEYAQFYVCIFTFLFDEGIFDMSEEEALIKLMAISELMERGLKAKTNSLSFVYDKELLSSMRGPVRLSG